MSDENRRIAIELLEAFVAQDQNRIRELIHEDARWWVGSRTGTMNRDELMSQSASVFTGARRKGIKVTGTTAEGERVAVEFEGDFELADGTPYNNIYHTLFVVRDGRVVSAREYLDTALVQRVFKRAG
jgi:ketosteroid isomerase-like protein